MEIASENSSEHSSCIIPNRTKGYVMDAANLEMFESGSLFATRYVAFRFGRVMDTVPKKTERNLVTFVKLFLLAT